MTTATLTAIDYTILAAYLAAMLGVGAYFSHYQKTTKDYFLAGRNMHWLPVGMSLVVTLFSALSFTGIPAEAFRSGMSMLPTVIDIWLVLPILLLFVIPFFYNLEIFTAYTYLEQRFDLSVRVAASVVFVLWRLLWLGGVIYAPCKVLLFTLGISESDNPLALYVLLVGMGVLTTIYTFLGGLKAVIWTDAMQFCVVIGGIALIFGFALFGPAGVGLADAWSTVRANGLNEMLRLRPPAGQSFWTDRWILWAFIPHYILAHLSFYTADQITLQRFLTTSDLQASKRSMITAAFAKSVIFVLLIGIGVCLHVFYAVNGSERAHLAQRAPLGKDVVEAAGGDPPPLDAINSDLVMPHFITTELPAGAAGLIVAALFAAAMSSLDSGLNSVATSMIIDFNRRLGIGRKWLADRLGKPVETIDEADELTLARPLCLVLGAFAIWLAIIVSQLKDIFSIMIGVVNTFGGPLLAVFLLGMFTRRTGPRGALAALLLGMLGTVWISFGPAWADRYGLYWLWPWDGRWADIWNLTFSVAGTLVIGLACTLVFDDPPSRDKLDGLTAGVGRAGLPSRAARLSQGDAAALHSPIDGPAADGRDPAGNAPP